MESRALKTSVSAGVGLEAHGDLGCLSNLARKFWPSTTGTSMHSGGRPHAMTSKAYQLAKASGFNRIGLCSETDHGVVEVM